MKKKIVLLALAGLVLALAPAAQAGIVDYVDFVGDASALLNLEGRAVLAAVNFYDPDRVGFGNLTVDNPIQGVTFDNFRVNVDDTGSPIALSTGATLATVIAQSAGREFWAAAGSGSPGETQIGSFSPQNADNIEAERLANGGAFYQAHTASDLTFAFGAGWANTPVEVQMLGGGVWNLTGSYKGILTASVDGVDLGYVEDNGYNMQLSTFQTTADGNGDLLIDLTLTGDRYAILAGITVTAVPEPATMLLLGLGGLVLRRRKRA